MREKKSENLEVRLPHRLKADFMARCRAEGRSASEAVRGMIESYLVRPTRPSLPELAMLTRPKIAIPTALAAATLTAALFAASTTQAGPDLREAFKALDANRDGAVTLAEFSAGGRDRFVFVGRARAGEPAQTGVFTLPLKGPLEIKPGAPLEQRPLTAARIYTGLDADRSGSVDFAEFERHHNQRRAESFASLDADGDGRVTADEFWRPIAAGPEAAGLKARLTETFSRLDADGDGAISRGEFAAF